LAGPASSAEAPSTRVNLETSVASPTVVAATGVSAHDVRAALPSWKFTECYRRALQRDKTLEGHVTLHVSFGPEGAVSRVGARGPAPLLSATGDCMMDALSHASVNATPESGATADIDVACTPR
jgi:hypothetical protein